jgi:hypothetical protein
LQIKTVKVKHFVSYFIGGGKYNISYLNGDGNTITM